MFVHSIKTDVGQVQMTENKKSGMINNGYENQIDPVAYNILDRIGQATGVKIKVVPQINRMDNQGRVLQTDVANGQYDSKSNTLEISMTSENPVMVVAKHEITHMLQQKSPELYEEYKEYVINSMKEAGTYESVFAEMYMRHRLAGIEASESYIQDEIVADSTETFLTNKTAIDNLVRENKTLGQKILDIIREFIKKVDEAVKGVTTGWMGTEQLRVAERMWVEALNSVMENERNRIKKANLNQNDSLSRPLSDSFDNSISQNDKNDNNKFSLKYDDDNNPVVFIDTNIFEGREGKKHNIIAEYISEHIGEMYTIIESGQKVYIGEDLPGEYTHSVYTKKILHNRSKLNAKNQASQGLGELIEIASNREWAKNTKEKHKIDAKYGFYYYTSKLAIKTNYNHADKYTVQLVIRNDADGKKYLYDIENIKKTGTLPLASTQKGQLSGGQKTAATLPVNNSISQNNKNDNNNFEKNNNIDNTNIEGLLLENHKEYNNNKEALKLAREGIEELSKIRYSLSRTRREMGGSGINTIADGICREFIQKGYTELKGRKVNNVEDLAEIAQVFRDPRFETFRIFYIKKNKIVAHEGISSRIPGLLCAFLNIPKKSDFDNDFDYAQARKNGMKQNLMILKTE